MRGLIIENLRPVFGIAAQNASGTATTGIYVGMRHHRRCLIQIQTGAWAGGTAAVTLNQATTQAAGTTKALAFAAYYVSTSAADSPVKTTATSNTFNLSAANTLYQIEVLSQDLDNNNGYNYLAVLIASPGGNADYYSATYQLGDGEFVGLQSNFPSCIT